VLRVLDVQHNITLFHYHAQNVPSARAYASLVDRKDGTLMMTSGRGHFSQSGIYDTQNDVWLFNKTLKQWKLVYGSATQGSVIGSLTNYRAWLNLAFPILP
jgi:hypothetical protein